MKIYISGQITGLKEKEAKIYFDRAEKMLLEKEIMERLHDR